MKKSNEMRGISKKRAFSTDNPFQSRRFVINFSIMQRLICALSIILAAILLLPAAKVQADSGEAKDLTNRCELDAGAYKNARVRIMSRKMDHFQNFGENTEFSLSWDDDVPAAQLCLQWNAFPELVTVTQYDGSGATLCSEVLPSLPETVTQLSEDARKVVIRAGEKGMQVYYCRIYGEGTLPDPFHEWTDTPEKLDFLVISTHPDDDILYLGSVIPVYGAEQGYKGTTVYVTCAKRVRMTEAYNGCWALGLRCRPIFLDFPDIPRTSTQEEKDEFKYEDLVCALVRLYRRYRPAVTFAQDKNGEYGHWQHKLTSKASVEAAVLAADPAYDPESVEQYGTWQVQKAFLHMYEENRITIDAHAKLTFFGGDDAYNVARKAFQKHETQKDIGYAVTRDRGEFAFNQFGMAFGVVEVGEDVFDNIDEQYLSSYVPPTPAPTEEPTATPVPTDTPAPTEAPTEEPTEEPTAQPERTPAPEQSKLTKGPYPWIALGALACVGAVCAAVFGRKKRSE